MPLQSRTSLGTAICGLTLQQLTTFEFGRGVDVDFYSIRHLLKDDKQYQIAYVQDGTGKHTWYVDGNKVSSSRNLLT